MPDQLSKADHVLGDSAGLFQIQNCHQESGASWHANYCFRGLFHQGEKSPIPLVEISNSSLSTTMMPRMQSLQQRRAIHEVKTDPHHPALDPFCNWVQTRFPVIAPFTASHHQSEIKMPVSTIPDEIESSEEGFRPEMIKAPVIQRVYDYWLDKRGDAAMPLSRNVDILDLEFAVGALSFIDVIDPTSQTPRFFLRMIGSEIVIHHGVDNTGKFVEDLREETRTILDGSYSAVVSTAEPFWIERKTFAADHIYVYECLILPLCDENDHIVRLVSVLNWPDSLAPSG